jgi:hypothetical protein
MIVLSLTSGGVSQLAVRRLGDLTATPIFGTEQGTSPAISPDGLEVAFVSNGQVRIAPISGGVVRTVADSATCCTRWGRDGYVTFRAVGTGILRVPGEGEAAETALEMAPGDDCADFDVDADHDVAVFTNWGNPFRVEAVQLSTGEWKVVTPGVKPFLTDEGYLIFGTVEGQILAVRFDPEQMALVGPATPLVDGVRVDGDVWPYYSVACNGTLLYWSGASTSGNDGRVVRVDRSGSVTPVDPDWLFNPGTPEVAVALSPDGRRLAVKVTSDGGDDIWVKQLDDGPLSRLTFDDAVDRRPRWSADGSSILFNSDRLSGTGHYDL